ncbi:MAG: NitT/TauT family transport system ATP-binding protein [Verrucomicrobiales bacterium]|jgi:NitT/TauT family transport system ATP-binding protein
MVFQHYTLFPWLTVLENAFFADRLAINRSSENTNGDRSSDIRKRALQLLELTGLDGFQDAYPKELSGGMQQRVAIVRALANRPKVLLMDEPFGALDSQTREEMQEMLLLLSRVEKITIIFVTHDIEEALFLSDRILILSQRPGRVAREERIPFGSERSPSLKLTEPFWKLKRSLVEFLHDGQPPSFAREKLLEALHDKS